MVDLPTSHRGGPVSAGGRLASLQKPSCLGLADEPAGLAWRGGGVPLPYPSVGPPAVGRRVSESAPGSLASRNRGVALVRGHNFLAGGPVPEGCLAWWLSGSSEAPPSSRRRRGGGSLVGVAARWYSRHPLSRHVGPPAVEGAPLSGAQGGEPYQAGQPHSRRGGTCVGGAVRWGHARLVFARRRRGETLCGRGWCGLCGVTRTTSDTGSHTASRHATRR